MKRADWRDAGSIGSPEPDSRTVKESGAARLVLGSLAAVAAVISVAWIDYRVLHINSATAAFTFLLLVLGFATRVGLRESIIASFGSMLAYNFFFLPPVGTFTIADPQNWVALFAFLATAVTVSQLSSSAQRKAEEASAREEELRRIYNFSRALMLADSDRSFINHVTQQLSQSFELEDVSFYESATDIVRQISDSGQSVPEALLRRAAASGEVARDADRQVLVVPVRLGKDSLGSIGVVGTNRVSEMALQASAQLVAIAIESARAQRTASLLEATRQNEQLKSTLLDALAHEFKTPLTSVKAATTTLLARRTEDQVQAELLTVIDEEADRMTKLVSDSIELAKIGSGPVALHRELFPAEALISSTVAELRPLFEERELTVTTEPSLPLLHVDIKLSSLALRQLLNNALKYSPAGTPVTVDARKLDQHFVVFSVSNEGPGISKSEQALLFEKFYRGRESRTRVPGTGLGLNITREIVVTQGGRIWIESEPDQGVTFSFTLPIGAPDRAHRPKRQIAS
jgi:two-component system, OmpR family, sensor histidine kinase KdpD